MVFEEKLHYLELARSGGADQRGVAVDAAYVGIGLRLQEKLDLLDLTKHHARDQGRFVLGGVEVRIGAFSEEHPDQPGVKRVVQEGAAVGAVCVRIGSEVQQYPRGVGSQ